MGNLNNLINYIGFGLSLYAFIQTFLLNNKYETIISKKEFNNERHEIYDELKPLSINLSKDELKTNESYFKDELNRILSKILKHYHKAFNKKEKKILEELQNKINLDKHSKGVEDKIKELLSKILGIIEKNLGV